MDSRSYGVAPGASPGGPNASRTTPLPPCTRGVRAENPDTL